LKQLRRFWDISGRSFITLNFFMNLAFSISLNQLWSLANALQIIVHLPLLNLAMPFNVQQSARILANVASFELLPANAFYNLFLKFSVMPKEKVGVRFSLLGFEGYSFLINTGTLFWLLCFWLVKALVFGAYNLA